MSSVSEIFSESGPLAQQVAGFASRAEQLAMAEAAEQAISEEATLIVEAGTGTGKTFAYLVPALLSGRKVILSTGTLHLQDQLYNRDLPVVRKALGLSPGIALLKGRSNYLCLHRLGDAHGNGRELSGRQVHELELVRAWSGRTRSGDIAEMSEVPENSAIWHRVTSTTENCLGQECSHYQECHVVRARRAAMDADIVVINHHLLFADMVLKEEGFGELLPGADAVVIDEAHQLPEVASLFFGRSVSSYQLLDLARDLQVEAAHEAGDVPEIPEFANRLDSLVRQFRLALGKSDRRAAWSEVASLADVAALSASLVELLRGLEELLASLADRGKGMESCWGRCRQLLEAMRALSSKDEDEAIRWYETHRTSFRLNLTPLNVAPAFRNCLETLPGAWIFTSATLAVGESFGHFSGQLGLEDARTLKLDSPYDYRKNAMLYLPDDMPEPNHPGYVDAVVDCTRKVLKASRGRAFVLFTSHAALKAAAKKLEDTTEYPLLVQGTAPRQELLSRFRTLGNAVLLGTGSFWEGVDVRGESLSCVIIDKLPFGSPGEPVLQARIAAMREQGINPFYEYQLPQAVIALKQGIGRLIRDEHDRGVLVLCDPRLRTKSYGKVFLRSLPGMNRADGIDALHEFFSGLTPETSCA